VVQSLAMVRWSPHHPPVTLALRWIHHTRGVARGLSRAPRSATLLICDSALPSYHAASQAVRQPEGSKRRRAAPLKL